VQSAPGQGSTVRLLFPAAEGPLEFKPQGQEWRGAGLALVVDDEPGVRQLAALVLELLGFQVVQAEDGVAALAQFEKHAAALRLVLLDLTMPRLDGARAFEELHRARPELPVILMSGYSEGELTQRFAGLGLAGFLQKPFNVDGLIAKVKAVLGG
jgi:CheY-like chemotaxis protein